MSFVNENKDMSGRLCRGWHEFLHSPGKWAGFSGHDKVVQMAESR